MNNKYKHRKEIIKKVVGLSVKIDDSLEGVKREILVLMIKFFIFILSFFLVSYAIIARNYIQLTLFIIIMLSSFLTYLNQIKKYRLTKALHEVKKLRKIQNEYI